MSEPLRRMNDPGRGGVPTLQRELAGEPAESPRAEESLPEELVEQEQRATESTAALGAAGQTLRAESADHRRTEGTAEDGEERFRLAVEAAPNGMIMIGADGRITLVNSETERLFGYAREELLGQPIEMLVPERFRRSHVGERTTFLAQPQTRPMGVGRDLHGLRKDGTEVPIEIGLNPIRSSAGTCVLASVIDITARKRAEQTIRQALHEKEILLQELHHRVKNNLQVISSLLELQSGYLNDPQAVAAFRECQGRIRSMALIHETLYQSESLDKVDVAEHLNTLAGMLVRTYAPQSGSVKLETHLAPVSLSLDSAIPLGLITHELVSNCFKHAFPQGRDGVVRIALQPTPAGDYALVVEDNGVGLPADFQLEGARSLGLRLVAMLAKEMGGRLTLDRDGAATRFILTFADRAHPAPPP